MPSTSDLLAELRRRGVADCDDAPLTRALYATDASLYRVPPRAVARPRDADELLAVLDVARTTGVPLTARGAGTSIAGNAVGPGLVVDCARHLHRVVDLDPEERLARVEPGVVHAVLQGRARAHGLRLGPDPSSHTRCTVGGMVGNNACGSRALGYGRTSDVVEGLRVALGTGEVVEVGPAGSSGGAGAGALAARLGAVVDADLGHVRTGFGRFSRQVSGYALEHLLPESGRRLDRFLVGSEGTLGLVLGATVRLAADPPATALVALGYPSMPEAADAVPALLAACGPAAGGAMTACEGLDARIVDLVRARPGHGVPELPPGTGWLLVEVAGASSAEAVAQAQRVVASAGALGSRVVAGEEAAALWRIRESGAGLAARSLGRPAHAGWEDAAVPPEQLGGWLREFDALLADHGLAGVPYGHFGDGCVHVRVDVPFAEETAAGREAEGVRRFSAFLEASARALAARGGSLSGEHGDGRARSSLLPLVYDDRSLALFAAVKRVCDPDGVLNPGVLVDPAAATADLRPPRPRREPPLALRFVDDGGAMTAAVHRCTGVGACVAPGPELGRAPAGGGVMCPSWVATREEKDSTRGRARVLQEALDAGTGGDALVRDLADPAVHEALDLCLACKGCARDCPTGVDVATYKAEALHQRWRGRLRPRTHYALGRLPTWARLASPVAGALNAVAGTAVGRRLAAAVAGTDPARTLPPLSVPAARAGARAAGVAGRLSESPVSRGFRHFGAEASADKRGFPRSAGETDRAGGPTPDVWIWADTFTDRFAAGQAEAAVRLLASAGLRARVVDLDACCGLTLVTTGQLDAARRRVERTLAALAPYAASGAPLLGLEPSCVATLRDDARRLTADPRAALVAGALCTLAEVLDRLAVPLPDLTGVEVVAQPHCHHASVLGWERDEALLTRAGAQVTRVGGCCGLAGSWGMERGHGEVSRAVAETRLLPAVREAPPGAVVLADGVSCRHQLADLAGVTAVHLADLLASRLPR